MTTSLILALGLLLVIAPAGYLAYRQHKATERNSRATALEENLESGIKETVDSDNKEEKEEKRELNRLRPKPEPADKLLSDAAVGVVRIDKIDVLLPIYGDSSDQSLLDGAGMLEGTALPTSEKNSVSVLTGHRGGRNGDQTFMHIDKLAIDDEIKVTTRDEVLYYKVKEQEIIEPTDWSRFTKEEDKSKLILMSCHPYPSDRQRILVKAELSKSISKKQAE